MTDIKTNSERDTPLFDPFLEGACDTESVNSLLRGELSAVESYDQALERFADAPAVSELRMMRREHFTAASELRDRVRAYGGEPADSSGAWGVFAAAITGTAKVFGMKSALAALKQGEEHGVSVYQAALDNDEIAGDCRSIIRGELLPMCRQHVAVLNNMMSVAS
jgi:hypothetical protein